MERFENLVHQITLLSINPVTGRVRNRSTLAVATAGAALAELALQERVGLVDRLVQVHDSRPTEDPLLDIMLGVLNRQPDRRPERILDVTRSAYLNQALGELVSNGWVIMTPGAFSFTDRYQIVGTELYEQAKALASSGLRDPEGCSIRAACLAGLAAQLELTKELTPELKMMARSQVKARLAKRGWVVKAVQEVMGAREAVVVATTF